MTLRVFSSGAGVQSVAAMVLAAQGRLDFPRFVFSNVGEDSENPATLRYVAEHAQPFAAAHALEWIEVRRRRRDGTYPTVYGEITRPDTSTIGIPVRGQKNGKPFTRRCTVDFKIEAVGKWLRAHGATAAAPATLGIGFSLDEMGRAGARVDPRYPYFVKEYPLIDLRLTRNDCLNVIRDAGLPPPPKSACFFCPFHRPAEWQRLQREEPEQFARSCDLEDTINARRARLGKDPVYLTRFGRPLREVFSGGVQLKLADLDDGACDSGFCWR